MGQPHEVPTVSKEYSGKWIAWNFERTQIIASGRTLVEAKRASEVLGEKRPVLAKAPRANVRFIGGK